MRQCDMIMCVINFKESFIVGLDAMLKNSSPKPHAHH